MFTRLAPQPPVVVMSPAPSDWQTGFDIYLSGKGESACANTRQVAGWWAALDAESACALCDTMAAAGKSGAEMDMAINGMNFYGWRNGVGFKKESEYVE